MSSESCQAKPSQAMRSQAMPSQSQPSQSKPIQALPSQAKPSKLICCKCILSIEIYNHKHIINRTISQTYLKKALETIPKIEVYCVGAAPTQKLG
jgi:hypothetical protein